MGLVGIKVNMDISKLADIPKAPGYSGHNLLAPVLAP